MLLTWELGFEPGAPETKVCLPSPWPGDRCLFSPDPLRLAGLVSPVLGLGPCPRLDSVPLRRSWIPAQAGHPGGSPPAGAGVPKGGAPGDRGERRASQLGRCPRLRSRAASGPRRRAECVRAIDLLFVLPDLPARVTPPFPPGSQQTPASDFVPVTPATGPQPPGGRGLGRTSQGFLGA